MKTDKKILLQQLANEVKLNITAAQRLEDFSNEKLTENYVTNGWSIAQIIEHLNTYNAFYLPAIENATKQATTYTNANTFNSGLLGNYFVEMMKPENGRINKRYKAASRHIPKNIINAHDVLTTYLNGQLQLLKLLDVAERYDLNTIKIPTSISNLIKLKVGDVFRFLIAHQQRHFVQIENVLSSLSRTQSIQVLL